MPRFTLRDLFWLVLVVALAVGWWSDHRRLAAVVRELQWTDVAGAGHIVGFSTDIDCSFDE